MILKNKLAKRACAALLVVGLAAGSAAAASTVTVKNIQAHYQGIKIVVDGVEITPKDAAGAVVEPFISDGTTYLPVRAIANALGKDVDWDGETKTVYIGEIPGQETNWMIKLPPYQWNTDESLGGIKQKIYDGTNAKETFSVAGVPHTVGICLSTNGGKDGWVLWNTNSMYKSMTFTIGSMDGNTKDTTLDIYLNGEFLTSYDLKWDDPPKTITVPVNYAANLKLHSDGSWATYGIYDISFQ